MSDISARIERIPFSRFHWNLLFLGGLSYMFDGLDTAVIAFVLPVLRSTWSLTGVQTGMLGSAGFVGYFFGALLAGLLGDSKGRRPVMMWALVVYSLSSIAAAFTHNWLSFAAFRSLSGFGAGAEAAIVAPFLSEFVSRHHRGRFTGSLAAFFSFGFLGAALLGYFVVPHSPQGWRYLLGLTGLPIAMLLWWRRSLPESPRWLVSAGRPAEAERIVAAMERSALRSGYALSEPAASPVAAILPVTGGFSQRLKMLWLPGLRRITVMTWLVWLAITFSYYAFFTWIPTLLVQNGMSIARSFSFSLAIYCAMVPGYFSAAWMNEKIGRQATIATYMLLGGASAIALSLGHSDANVMIGGCCLSFFMNGTYAGVYAYTPEVFPTDIRATGMGLASSIGRIGAILSPVLVGGLYPRVGFAGVFGATTLVLLIGAIAVITMGISTRNRSLEDIAAEELSRGRPG